MNGDAASAVPDTKLRAASGDVVISIDAMGEVRYMVHEGEEVAAVTSLTT